MTVAAGDVFPCLEGLEPLVLDCGMKTSVKVNNLLIPFIHPVHLGPKNRGGMLFMQKKGRVYAKSNAKSETEKQLHPTTYQHIWLATLAVHGLQKMNAE